MYERHSVYCLARAQSIEDFDFLIFGLFKHTQGSLVGSLELGFRSLVLLNGLLEFALQLLPLVVRELLELLQVIPVVAGTPLQSLLHL